MSLSEQFGDGAGLVGQLGALLRTDGLSDLLAGFNDAGQESEVESWVGTIANRPTDEGAVKRAVGRTRLAGMAEQLGASPDDVAAGLARVIPSAVDALTPGGRLPSGSQLDGLDLGALLSKVDVGSLLR
jgi:uncharacterized protein YidB (DUF937 family)